MRERIEKVWMGDLFLLLVSVWRALFAYARGSFMPCQIAWNAAISFNAYSILKLNTIILIDFEAQGMNTRAHLARATSKLASKCRRKHCFPADLTPHHGDKSSQLTCYQPKTSRGSLNRHGRSIFNSARQWEAHWPFITPGVIRPNICTA